MRTPWSFNGYSFPTNPEEDSGWTPDILITEKNSIGGSSSRFHVTGFKSDRRQTSGYFFGLNAIEQRDQFESWFRGKVQATLTDHMGVSRRAMLVKFAAKPINDVGAYRAGRATFRFEAEWIALN